MCTDRETLTPRSLAGHVDDVVWHDPVISIQVCMCARNVTRDERSTRTVTNRA
jgi:hypothetical protein